MSDSQFQLIEIHLDKISAHKSDTSNSDELGIGIQDDLDLYNKEKILNLKIDLDFTLEGVNFVIALKSSVKVLQVKKGVTFENIGEECGPELAAPLLDKASLIMSTILSDMIGLPRIIDLTSMIDLKKSPHVN